ncbi:MAG: hypothetical protein AB7V26_00425 [Lysobacterales bacterium]
MHRLIATFVLLFAVPAAAWELRVERLQAAEVVADELVMRRQADRVILVLSRLQQAPLGIDQNNLRWSCALSSPVDGSLGCAGSIKVGSPAWRGRLLWESRAGRQSLRLGNGSARIEFIEAAAGTMPEGSLQLVELPLGWLDQHLRALWTDLATVAGRIQGRLQIDRGGAHVHGPLAFDRVAFDSHDGSTAAAELAIAGSIDFALDGSERSLHWQGSASAGEVLFGAIYFALPEAGARIELSARAEGEAPWQLPQIEWHDGDGLDLSASASFASDGSYRLRVQQLSADLSRSAPRYLKSALATAGFDGLRFGGRLDASALWDGLGWQEFAIKLRDGLVRDPDGRIEADGLHADLAMNVAAPANTLAWQNSKLFGIPFGAGQTGWTWSPQQITLSQPLTLELLGGRLTLPRLERLPAASNSPYWLGALELDRLSVGQLAAALDWPGFSGSLSGHLPQFRLQDGGLQFDGDLELKVFDGSMRISHLASERSFGIAPSLSADIVFDNLDLGQLSAAFSFGEMQGWLDGRINGLRLLDWAPVAFDARLLTDPAFPGKQRLSQRAVQGISSVAGSAGATSNPLIRMFDSFGYKQIGIDCRLADNVCHMSGLEPTGTGYTVVKGSGLPRLNVIAFQQRVDWPVLVQRLRAMAEGQAPRIE